MRVSNETYKICPKCEAEANGLDEIDRVFGYHIVKEVITPCSVCRECGGKKHVFDGRMKKRQYRTKKWASAAEWGRRIYISRKIFDSYLVDLGYLENDFKDTEKERSLVITDKGKEHSAITNSSFRKIILWDYETYLEVVKIRADRAVVHDICPKCKAHLDTMPDYKYSDYSHTCRHCGRVCNYWNVDVVYDR